VITGDEVCEPEKMREVVASLETSSVREKRKANICTSYVRNANKKMRCLSVTRHSSVERNIRTEARTQDVLPTNNVYKK